MALSDPQSLTINGVATSLPLVGRVLDKGVYRSADGNVQLQLSHAYGKRSRRVIRVDFRKIAADPLISAQNIEYSMSAYLVVDLPKTGFTVAEAGYVANALTAYLTASTNAKMTNLLSGES